MPVAAPAGAWRNQPLNTASTSDTGILPVGSAKVLQGILLLAAMALFALHFVHLAADFPNFSRWMDWSKYTDEGWYGDAAIRFFELGHWYVPGDFNPAVALPVWPLLEAALFRFTGVSLVAERALTVGVFGGILLASWLLIARSQPNGRCLSLAASVAVLLLAANPFCFVFTRMGILEPLLILLTLVALLITQSVYIPPAAEDMEESWFAASRRLCRANLLAVLGLGLVVPLMILTKTTGLFLIPAIAAMLFLALACRPRLFLQVAVPTGLLASGLWSGYFLLIVRPHYLGDYRYLFSANAYTGITRKNWLSVLYYTVHGSAWMGRYIFLLALASALVAAFSVRRLRSYPVIPALMLWALGYGAFLAYHNNLQPRYYLVIAVPLTLLVPVVFEWLVLARLSHGPVRYAAAGLFAMALTGIVLSDTRQTVSFVRHPEYTFLHAAERIQRYIAADRHADPAHSSLILSISGSDISLMTGLHSICDDFGTSELADRVKKYHPGWDVSWNLIEDDKMDALAPLYRVHRVATFPAMDDQDRNVLILYRLDRLETSTGASWEERGSRHRSRFKGQRPSVLQLTH